MRRALCSSRPAICSSRVLCWEKGSKEHMHGAAQWLDTPACGFAAFFSLSFCALFALSAVNNSGKRKHRLAGGEPSGRHRVKNQVPPVGEVGYEEEVVFRSDFVQLEGNRPQVVLGVVNARGNDRAQDA